MTTITVRIQIVVLLTFLVLHSIHFVNNIFLYNVPFVENENVATAMVSRNGLPMEMSAPKSKGMHVRVRERLPVSTEVEVEALDLPHSCPECERSFPTTRGLVVHRARCSQPGQRPASRRGQLADKAVKLGKRKASAA